MIELEESHQLNRKGKPVFHQKPETGSVTPSETRKKGRKKKLRGAPWCQWVEALIRGSRLSTGGRQQLTGRQSA